MKKEWNDRQVEALLRKAVGRSVPDIYRQVAAQEVPPLINEDHIVPPPVRRRRRRWPYVLALLALAAAGIVLYLLLSTAAIIAVGENRDVELSVNRFQRVLDVRSHTSVGDAVLEGQSLEHQQVDDALEAVFTAMAAQGYLDGMEQLPIQVDGGSWQYNRALLNTTQDKLDKAVQAFGADDGAPQSDPAPGVTQTPVTPTPAPVQPSAQPSVSQSLTEDQACQAALDRAGLSADAALFTKLKLDWEDGRQVYELEFCTDSSTYDCLVDAATGEVLQFGQEMLSRPSAAVTLSAQQARQTALDHTGLTQDQVFDLQTELETDDGQVYYEVEFQYSAREYKCAVDAATGAVLWEEWDD